MKIAHASLSIIDNDNEKKKIQKYMVKAAQDILFLA
jgi:hypothetical protein